jgi:hypothetical protein
MNTYRTTWIHEITKEVMKIEVQAKNKISAILKTTRKVEEKGLIEFWDCITPIL